MKKFKLLFDAIGGNILKIKVWLYLTFNKSPRISEKIADNVIVSLTSYNRRVYKSVPFTVFSILTQSIRPEKVVLWLDEKTWNNENIPFALRRMIRWSNIFEIRYCEDIKSYTKLIPSLKTYPDKAIITIDDDIYYSKQMVKQLYIKYISAPRFIYSLRTATYKIEIDDVTYSPTILLGYSGVLYPPNSLSNLVFDRNIYMRLCLHLDDLWFYVMGIINGYKTKSCNDTNIRYYLVDALYQKVHKNSRLYTIVKENNQKVLRNLLSYLKIQNYQL